MNKTFLMSAASLLSMGAVVLVPMPSRHAGAQAPPPVNLIMGAGMTLSPPGTAYHGGTGTLSAGTGAGLIGAVDNRFTVNAGTLHLANQPGLSVMMNSAGTPAEPNGVPVGAGLGVVGGTLVPAWRNLNTVTALDTNFFTINSGTLTEISRQGPVLLGVAGSTIGPVQSITLDPSVTLSPTGTLSVASPGTGTVTGVETGAGLTGGPVTGKGTIALATRTASTLLGNAGTVAAVPSDITVGANLTLTTAGTLNATPPNPGTVSQVVAGAGLTGGTITTSGTIAAATINTGLAGNAGTTAAVPSLIAVGANLTLTSGGTLNATNPGTGTVAQIIAGNGLAGGTITGTGTISDHNQGTSACSGAITITATAGTDNWLVNIGSAACTIDIGAPNYTGQPLRLQIKNGATAQTMATGATVLYGTTVPTITMTPTANFSDFMQLFAVNTSRWAVGAISQGFSF